MLGPKINKLITAILLSFLCLCLLPAESDGLINLGNLYSCYSLRGSKRSSQCVSLNELDLIIGVSSYIDREKDIGLGYYAQVPIVKWDSFRISFGVIMPERYTSRNRPEFSASVLLGELLKTPYSAYLPIEAGVYWAMSGYDAWGMQLGLLRIDW